MSDLKPADLLASLSSIEKEAFESVEGVQNSEALDALRLRYLGKKGQVSQTLAKLRSLSPEDKKEVGKKANVLKQNLEKRIQEQAGVLRQREIEKSLENDSLDASLNGVYHPPGVLHPIRQVLREAVEIFQRAGLVPVYGPEIEYEDYNFDRLNFKEGHAARDMQATFFVHSTQNRPLVLRTHTSPVQVRVLLEMANRDQKLPIRIQAPGRVYRCDDDRTHSPMFHQIEGLVVDQESGLGDLKAVMDFFARKFFDDNTKVRFRPSYFPFTEPSAEVDISCVFCKSKGCKVCKGSGWIEVGGCGLVHPEVFRACKWDPDEVQGWAFGMGVERLAMLKLGVPDLRSFFENRVSFLRGEAQS